VKGKVVNEEQKANNSDNNAIIRLTRLGENRVFSFVGIFAFSGKGNL
jgi:hypothetical protein